MHHFCIDFIPFASKRMIRCYLLYRVSLSPILTHKRYCSGCSLGQKGQPYARPVNAGLILALPDVPANSKDLWRLLSDFHKTWSIVHLSAVPWYILRYTRGQNIPRQLYKRGHSPCNYASPGDCGHQAAWPLGLALLCFHWPLFLLPPSEPKTSVLPTPPPFPDFFSHTLFTHIQIKKWAPSSLFY